jgi:hypothetical protein
MDAGRKADWLFILYFGDATVVPIAQLWAELNFLALRADKFVEMRVHQL